MPTWLARTLIRIHELAHKRHVRLTIKAATEIAGLALDLTDVCDVLTHLTPEDSAGRLRSTSTAEWLYVFKPRVAAMILYIKVILRSECLIVSFHESEEMDDDVTK